jgi:hypothetical protein
MVLGASHPAPSARRIPCCSSSASAA